MRMTPLASLVFLVNGLPAFAQTVPNLQAFDDSDWVSVSTTTNPGVNPGDSFSEPERVRLIEKLRSGVLDQLCRQAELNANFDFGSEDFQGTGGSVRRGLRQLPDGSLAIIDDEELSVGASKTIPFLDKLSKNLFGGLWLGARVEGHSMVIRPLGSRQSCKEIDRLVDLRDIKLILPMRGSRLAEMGIGELWRIPMQLTVGHAENLGARLVQNLTASLTFTGSESGTASITLYRLSEDKLRFRFRVDRAEVRGPGFRLVEVIPAIAVPTFGTSLLMKLVHAEIAHSLTKYAEVSLDYTRSKTNGKKIILEYVVDPRDSKQAEAVAKAVRGDFADLVRVGWRLASQQATDETTREYYKKLQDEHDAQLGPSSYAAMNEYTAKNRGGFHLNLGLFGFGWANTSGDDRMTRLDDERAQYLLNHAGNNKENKFLDLPFIGPVVKNERSKEVYVVTRSTGGGPHGDPMLVFIQQYGFLRAAGSEVRDAVGGYNAILRSAGSARPDVKVRSLELPSSRFSTPPPPPDQQEPGDHKGHVSFTLAVTQKGVREALAATAEQMTQAVMTVISDWTEPSAVSKAVEDFIADMREARDAKDNEARADALTKMLTGRGRTHLAYEEALRAFVQLVDPLDLRGEFVAQVSRPKKLGDVNMRLALRKDRLPDELLTSAAAAKNRFAEPSVVVDY